MQSPRFTNEYDFFNHFAQSIIIYWSLQIGAHKSEHQESHQRGTMHDKFAIFCKIEKEINKVIELRDVLKMSFFW